MKKIVFLILLLCSCYKDINLNEYPANNPKYFWYYDKELFDGAKYCHLIGDIRNDHFDCLIECIDMECNIYNDTLYIRKKYTYPKNNNIFEGTIYIKDIKKYIKFNLYEHI